METLNSKVTELTQFPNGFLFGVSDNENLDLFQRFITEEQQKTGKFPEKLSGIFLASNNTDPKNNLAPDVTSKNQGHFISVVAVLGENNLYHFVINNPLGNAVEDNHKDQFTTNISNQLGVIYQNSDIVDVSSLIGGKDEQNINSLGCGPLAIADSSAISDRINNINDIDSFQPTTELEDSYRETRARNYYDQVQKQRQLINKVLKNKDIGNLTNIINELKTLKNQISLNPNDKDAIIRAQALVGNLSDPSLFTALEDIKKDIEANKNKISHNIANESSSLNIENGLRSLPSFGLGAMLIAGPFVGLTGITEIVGSINPEMINWVTELRSGAGEVFDWLSDNTKLFGEISTELNLLRESSILKDGSCAFDLLIPPTELVTSIGALYGISLVADTYEAKERNKKQISEKFLKKKTDATEQLEQKSQESYSNLSTQVSTKTEEDLKKLAPKSESQKPETKQQKSKSSANDSDSNRSHSRRSDSDSSQGNEDGAENSKTKTVLLDLDDPNNSIDDFESVHEMHQAGPKSGPIKPKQKNLSENSEYSSDFESDDNISNETYSKNLPQINVLNAKNLQNIKQKNAEAVRKQQEDAKIKAEKDAEELRIRKQQQEAIEAEKDAEAARKQREEDARIKEEAEKQQPENKISTFLSEQKQIIKFNILNLNESSYHFDWYMFPSFTNSNNKTNFHVDHNTKDGLSTLKELWDNKDYIKNYLDFTNKYLADIKDTSSNDLYEIRFNKMVQSLVGFNKVAKINNYHGYKEGSNEGKLQKLLSTASNYIKEKTIKPSDKNYTADFQALQATQLETVQIDTTELNTIKNTLKQHDASQVIQSPTSKVVVDSENQKRIGDILNDFGLCRGGVNGDLVIQQQDMGEAMMQIFEKNKEMDKYLLSPLKVNDDGFNLAEYKRNEYDSFEEEIKHKPEGRDLEAAKKQLTAKIKIALRNGTAISQEDCTLRFTSNDNHYKLLNDTISGKITRTQNNSSDITYGDKFVVDILNKPQIHFIKRTVTIDQTDLIKKLETDPEDFKVALKLNQDSQIDSNSPDSIFKYNKSAKNFQGENSMNNNSVTCTKEMMLDLIKQNKATYYYKDQGLNILGGKHKQCSFKDKTDFSDAEKGEITDPILGERKITHFTVHKGESIKGGHYDSYQLGEDNNWYHLKNSGTGATERCTDNPLNDKKIRENIFSYVTLPYSDYKDKLPEAKDLLQYKTPNKDNFCFLLAMVNQINFLPDADRKAILPDNNNEFLQISKYVKEEHDKDLFNIDSNKRLVINDLNPQLKEIIRGGGVRR